MVDVNSVEVSQQVSSPDQCSDALHIGQTRKTLRDRKMKHINKILCSCTIFLVFAISATLSLDFPCFASDSDQPSVYHVVICWLKNPRSESDREKLIEETKKLQSIPGIISIKVGKMLPSERPIVDSTYDVGIIMSFKDQGAMNDYLKNPLHQKATKEILVPLTSKVVVYDFAQSE
jgi:hypothetical protein